MLIQIKPEAEEGFGSYLLRLASSNRIRTKKELHAHIGLAPLSARQGTEVVKSLSVFKRTTGLSKAEIEKIVPTIQENGSIKVNGLELREFHFQTVRRRFGIEYLKNTQSCHYGWQLDILPVCPVTLEVLQDRCPLCKHALEWHVSRGPMYCCDCGYKLTLGEPVTLDDEARAWVKPIIDFVFGDQIQRKQAEVSLPPIFRHYDPSILLQLVAIIGRSARYIRGDVRDFKNRYDYASTLSEFVEGARLIGGAPESLQNVMRTESRFRASTFLGEMRRFGRQIGTDAAQKAVLELCKQLKPDAPNHLAAIAVSRKRHDLMTLKEMAAELGVPSKADIRRLVDAGILPAETQPGDFKRITYVRRKEFERKRKPRPVFSGGLRSSKMPCFETRSMNFYGYAYAYD